MFAKKILEKERKSALGSAGHGTRDGRGGEGEKEAEVSGSITRGERERERGRSQSGIMSSSSTAVCRLDPRARRVRFLRGAPRAHNASYCGIRGPRRNGSGWRQRRLGPAARINPARVPPPPPPRNPRSGGSTGAPPPFSFSGETTPSSFDEVCPCA